MSDEITLKRLRIRSWRRGIKEMDLILGAFSDSELETLSGADLALYEEMLSENDQDLYVWVTGREPAPERFAALLSRIADHARSVGAQDRPA